MKYAVILAAVITYALAAPSTTNSGSTRQLTRKPVTNPASTFSDDDFSAFNDDGFGRRLSFIDANSKLRELDDDDLDFVTMDSTGRQSAFPSRETTAPLVNRATSKLSTLGGFASGQRLNNFMAFSDSGEIEDFDDLDDFSFFPSTNNVPFVNRLNSVRPPSRPSLVNPNNQSPVRTVNNRFVQVPQNNFRAPPTTCTCPPQRETVTRFQPAVSQANQLGQIMRFPQQQSFINRFVQPSNNFASMSQFPGVQFVFDD